MLSHILYKISLLLVCQRNDKKKRCSSWNYCSFYQHRLYRWVIIILMFSLSCNAFQGLSFLFLHHSIWSHIFSPLSLSRPILVYVHELSEQRNTVCVVYISFNIFSNVFLVFRFFFFLRKLALLVLINFFFLKCECEKVWINESGVHFLANSLVLGDLFLSLIQSETQNWHQLTLSTPCA